LLFSEHAVYNFCGSAFYTSATVRVVPEAFWFRAVRQGKGCPCMYAKSMLTEYLVNHVQEFR